MTMDMFSAAMIADGAHELAGYTDETITDEVVIEAFQFLIDTGAAWNLQGRIGRQAASMILDGVCHAANDTEAVAP
jgi:hypothetical protein